MDDERDAPTPLARYVIAGRERLGLNQTDFAKRAGLSKSEMNAIEAGRVKLPGGEKRRRLARALGVRHIDIIVAAGELWPDEIASVSTPEPSEADDLLSQLSIEDREGELVRLKAYVDFKRSRRMANLWPAEPEAEPGAAGPSAPPLPIPRPVPRSRRVGGT